MQVNCDKGYQQEDKRTHGPKMLISHGKEQTTLSVGNVVIVETTVSSLAFRASEATACKIPEGSLWINLKYGLFPCRMLLMGIPIRCKCKLCAYKVIIFVVVWP
jgi:hypothetical protein